MKVALIHLSDLHLKSNYCLNSIYENNIVKQIIKNSDNIDAYFFILSGDLTDTGNKNEYKRVSKFLNNLFKQFTSEKEKIKVFIVPGNHDMYFESDYLDDKSKFENKDYYSIQNEDVEIKRLKNFFNFSKNYNLFENNKIVDYKSINIGEFTLGFCMLNSALYSLKCSQGDKGYHHLDEHIIKRIEQSSKANLNIIICHHDLSWFDWNSKILLENLISNYFSIAFFGHEHYNSTNKISHNGYLDTYFFQEDKLFDGDELNSFSVVLIDFDKNNIISNQYVWNEQNKIFVQNEKINEKIILKTKMNRTIQLDDMFEQDITLLDKNGNDYFIFPKMEYAIKDKFKEQKENVNSYKEFLKLIDNKKLINIVGTDCVGKTTLLRYLFFMYLNGGFIPLIIDKDFAGKEISTILKQCFKKEYIYNDINFSMFNQSNKKILFIDDFESFKHSDKLLEKFKNEFYKVFIFNNKTVMGYEAKNEFLDIFKEDSTYIELSICRFSRTKRKDLINKVCSNFHSNTNKSLDKLADKIELELVKQQTIFKTDPLYIINFTKYHIQTPNENIAEKDVFNHVFTSSITNRLKEVDDEKFTKIAPVLLEKLSYFIHKNKKYPFEYNDFVEIATEYSNEIEKIDIHDYMDKILSTRIIKQIDKENYRFENKSYLSYFVALELQHLFNNKNETDELNYLMNNVCNGINSDILLYFSLLNNSEIVMDNIISKAKNNARNIIPFNLKDKKYSFLYPCNDIKINKPSIEEKRTYDEKISENEEILSSKEVIEVINYYDYVDINDNVTNDIIFDRTIKYHEILSEILINFYPIIKKEKKQEILSLLINLPNQIITLYLDNVEKNLSEIKRQLKMYENDIPWLKNNINKFISFVLINNLIIIYGHTSLEYSCEVLKENISNYLPKNEIEEMQQILSYSRFDDINIFLKSVAKFCNEKKNDFLTKIILKNIAKTTILFRNVEIDSTNRKIIDSIFSEKNEKIKLLSEIKKDR